MHDFDVIIVGYGPTGQVLAAVLGKAGHRVALVERWPTLYGLPRLTHIDDETARIVQSIADVDHALRDCSGINGYSFLNGEGEVLVRIGSSTNGICGFPRDISIYQPDIEEAIDATVRACPNVTQFFGYEALEVNKHTHAATVTIAPSKRNDGSGERSQLRGRFLVGCDGARSFVREAMGFVRTDHGFNERWCTIDAQRLRPLDPIFDTTVQFCDPARGHMHLAIGTKRVRFEIALLPWEEAHSFLEESFAWAWLRDRHGLGQQDLKIIRHTVYTFQARVAEQWRDGPVLIAGDAAHTMPPYLGQGACSGMRDGLNLGWKLDLVLRQLAHPALLDTYQLERKPHVTTITLGAIMLGKIANERDPARARARDEALKKEPPPPPVTPPLLDGLLAAERPPLAGTVWPQGRVTYRGKTGRFDTVVGNGFVLMTIAAVDDQIGRHRLDELARIGCRIVHLRDPEFQDVDGVYSHYFRDNRIAALLARPDFAVFGTAESLTGIAQLVDQLLAGLAGEPTRIMA